MNLEFQARYFLEHQALPHALYNEGSRMVGSFMMNEGKEMLSYYQRLVTITPEYDCPYNGEDFSVHFRTCIHDKDICMVLRVEMPIPEAPLLCRAVYLCFGSRGGYEMYVTSELAEDGTYFLCSWSDKGQHYNYGLAPEDANDELDMVANLFWNAIAGRLVS